MDDRMLMENYLLVLKSTVEVFVHGTLESSNKDVRMLLKEGLDGIMQRQASAYDEMTKYGWYPVNNVTQDVVFQTLNKLESQN